MDIYQKIESNVRNYSRNFPAVFDRAEGAVMITDKGTEYIDFFAGAGSLNYGHNHPDVNRAVIDYIGRSGITLSLDMATVAKGEFLETFQQLILKPRGLPYKIQFTGPTGTNAVEAAIKLARANKKRKQVIGFTNAFHGMSAGSLALTGNRFHHNPYYSSRDNVFHLPYDGYFRQVDTTAYIRKLLEDPSSGTDLPAAFIVEVIQCEGGINTASEQWLKNLEALCREFDILLIVDDIQTGNGRTGSFFSFEQAGLRPDLVCLSKSIGSGFPMSLLLIKPELDLWRPGEHSGTFRGNNLSMVAAARILNCYWQDDRLVNEIHAKESVVRDYLSALSGERPDLHIKVRGRGLLWGLEFGSEDTVSQITRSAFERGLLVESCGNGKVVKVMPPLIIGESLLETGLNILRDSVIELTAPGTRHAPDTTALIS